MKHIALLILCLSLINCRNNTVSFETIEPLQFFEVDISRTHIILNIIHSLDRDKIYDFVFKVISKNGIPDEVINSLDLSANREYLHLIDILGYYYDGRWHLLSNDSYANVSIMYYLTIEIGDGILPLANINGLSSTELYRKAIMADGRIIGTVRVWDVRNMAGGMFVFINFDKDMNIFFTYAHRYFYNFREG